MTQTELPKRALVISSQLPPLTGTDRDADAMETLLRNRGFAVVKLQRDAASRDGILAAYDQLIADAEPGSTAVVYFAGHGGHARNPSPAAGEREELQCIFPFDWTEAGECRAILDIELSAQLHRLTTKLASQGGEPNATVILDCCHSGGVSRGDEVLVPRLYGGGWAHGVPALMEKLRDRPDFAKLHLESNPHAVRVVATAPDRRAFETVVHDGATYVTRGLLTSALERELTAIGTTPVTWQTVIQRVCEQVAAISSEQWPRVEGPSDRVLFSAQRLKRPDAVPYFQREGKHFLRASRLLGAVKDAVYEIMPVGVVEHDPAQVVARATVADLEGPNARVELEPVAGAPAPGALAFPTKLPYAPLAIIAAPPDDPRGLVAGVLSGSIELVERSDQARFQLASDGTTISQLDRDGKTHAATPLADDMRGRALLKQRLERWAKAESVRSLVTEGMKHDAIDVRWGRVEAPDKQIAHDPGARMHVGESIYVTVTNRSDRALYLAIFDVGIGGKVALLTRETLRVEPEKSYTLGQRDNTAPVRGLGPFTWPEDVPKTAERPESLVVIATPEWTDFKAFETELLPTRSVTQRSGTGPNRLETLLDRFRIGRYRDLGAEPAEAVGHCVHRIDFDLVPTPRTGFAVDDALDQRGYLEALTTVPRSTDAAPPQRIAVRIERMDIHRNRALWGTTTVRIDALALTGAADPTGAFHAQTATFPRIGDGDRVPFDNLLIYEGPVARFVDLSIWVSRDTKGATELRALIDAASTDDKLRGALTTLAGLAVAAPAAATIAGAGLAIGTVISFSSKLISAAVDASIGLYRRSFLPHELLGVGRHPIEGLMQAQDFSFALSITAA